MKVKQLPSDFQVEELTRVTPGISGQFAFYCLEKTGWTTPDALTAVRRRWDIALDRLSYGGLKDRHAVTTQFFTIHNGPRRNLSHERISATYLGQVTHPFSSQDIDANRFTIVLRHLTNEGATHAESASRELARTGIPNYFDDQRFGSVGQDGRFVARELIKGQFEEALKLALAGSYEHDRAAEKAEKAILLQHWGNWPAAKAALPRGNIRSIVDYMVTHPTDFKGAVVRLRPELQGLYLAAYQSHIWNRLLDLWLKTTLPAEMLGSVELKLGRFAAPSQIPADLAEKWRLLEFPLASARLKPDPTATWLPLLEQILAEEGMTLATMRIPGVQKPFFSKGERLACVWPTQLTVEPGYDELNRGKRKLLMRFDLPRGCYATMIVKRVTAVSPEL